MILRIRIAAVVTPHLGAVLKLYEWQGDRLVEDRQAEGFSNHAIGSPEQGLADIADMNGDGLPDLIIPDAARRNLRIVTFSFGTFRQLAEVVNAEPISLAVLAQDLDGDGRPDLAFLSRGKVRLFHQTDLGFESKRFTDLEIGGVRFHVQPENHSVLGVQLLQNRVPNTATGQPAVLVSP